MYNTKFIQDFMNYYDYPAEAKELFTEVLEKLDSNKRFARSFEATRKKYYDRHLRIEDKLLLRLTALAKVMGYSEYTLHFVFLLSLTEELKNQYTLYGIDEKVYYETMGDLKYKLLECMECEKVPGTFVAGWYDGFFRMARVAYGRFQYEVATYTSDTPYTMKCGKVIKKGDKYIGFHIPSSGVPLTDEVRLASYKEAYKSVSKFFDDGIVIFGCGSWLLYPKHKEFLPEKLNIRRFMDDFEIISWDEKKDFHDGWRIFGYESDLPLDKLPTKTTLQKCYAEWLRAGNKAGSGFGLIAFDGDKILK
ncbi:MAG: acyltransferase domain-containing protein [Clostridia bacterium]|nr:acyltransferase domain-containing protein [Clostridia bacterium]